MEDLGKIFKPVVVLDQQRFNIWNVIGGHKNVKNILITFDDVDNTHKYACVRLDKLIELLYPNTKGITNGKEKESNDD